MYIYRGYFLAVWGEAVSPRPDPLDVIDAEAGPLVSGVTGVSILADWTRISA
jgi:hypothetical protein